MRRRLVAFEGDAVEAFQWVEAEFGSWGCDFDAKGLLAVGEIKLAH